MQTGLSGLVQIETLLPPTNRPSPEVWSSTNLRKLSLLLDRLGRMVLEVGNLEPKCHEDGDEGLKIFLGFQSIPPGSQ